MKIAAVGDNCMDVYEGNGEAYPGGNPVNVAVYTVRLGLGASYIGAVGQDEYGERMVQAIAGKGVDVSHLYRLPGRTAVTRVRLQNGERIFCGYDEGVLADFALGEADIDFLCSHDMVVTSVFSHIEGNLAAIRQRGTPVAFDFSNKLDHPVVEEALPQVDYAFFSWDGAERDEMYAYMAAACKRGPRLVVVTCGADGSVACDGREFYHFGILPCPVVDTMGAGDSYIAGFLRGVLLEKPVPECMRLGAENSCVTIGYTGAW